MLRKSVVFQFIVFSFCLPQVAWVAEPMRLDALLLKPRDNNPDIGQARHGWKVKIEEVGPAGSWPDPTLTFVDEKFPSGMVGVDPEHVKHYRVEQMIPFPGKLTNESRMKYHEALIQEAQ